MAIGSLPLNTSCQREEGEGGLWLLHLPGSIQAGLSAKNPHIYTPIWSDAARLPFKPGLCSAVDSFEIFKSYLFCLEGQS